jgi:prolyl 4-hydroxylase
MKEIKVNKVIEYALIFISISLIIILILMVGIKYFISTEFFQNMMADENDEYDEPRLLENLITEEEVNYIVQQASDKYEESTVVAGPSGLKINKNARDSKTAWLSKNDPIIRNIMLKVCKETGKSIENCEDLQVVKYESAGYYRPHHDSCCDDTENCDRFREGSGQRVRTCVIYLTNEFEGGATEFPLLNIQLKPNKGSGVLFHPMNKDESKCHPKALHAGMTIINGIKIIANVWIREKEFISRA